MVTYRDVGVCARTHPTATLKLSWAIGSAHRAMRESRNKIMVLFFVRRSDALGQAATVVFRQAVLPLQELGNRLRLDAYFHPPQARQQQVHLFHQAHWASQVLLPRLYRHLYLSAFALE